SLGMTSGVAGLVDAYAPPDVRDDLLAGLRAADVDDAGDGSMFLTERDGGSDLGRTVPCPAHDLGDGRVEISGEKWFCSNVDGAAIVLLARPDGAADGPAGLGLYLVPRVLEDGTPNHYSVRRLKEKLGTKSVPPGEVEFHDAIGYALRPPRTDDAAAPSESAEAIDQSASDAGGLARVMEVVKGSRFGVALMGLGIARRCFAEAAAWAHHRQARGRALVDLPLVREQLVDQLAELEAAVALGFECAAASGFGDGARLRRILVPAAKVRLCRLGVEAASYAVELDGGNGYCEDWGLTRQLRDAQCHPIWEGSENICVLDVLRAIRRDAAHEAVVARIDQAVATARGGPPGWATAGPRRRRRGAGGAGGPGQRRARARARRRRGAVGAPLRPPRPHHIGVAPAGAGRRGRRPADPQGPRGAPLHAPAPAARRRLVRRHCGDGRARAVGVGGRRRRCRRQGRRLTGDRAVFAHEGQPRRRLTAFAGSSGQSCLG